MKRIKQMIIMFLILAVSCSPVFGAQDALEGVKIRSGNPQILRTTELTSHVLLQPRSETVSMASISITNEGRGVIGVLATTLCHVKVDRIITRVILDRYNEKTGSWGSIEIYDFDYSAEDYPDELFTDAIVSFDITDKPSGYYYRVRGMHAVWKNGESQAYNTLTDGIMITDY